MHTAKLTALFATAACVILWGCGGGQAPSSHDDEWQATVLQALDTIADHGLPQWADYGRGMIERIGNSQQYDCLGMTVIVDGEAYIILRDEWEALDRGQAGEVLLEELWHAQTRVLSHTDELAALLAAYWAGG